jgi:hypothetical protein
VSLKVWIAAPGKDEGRDEERNESGWALGSWVDQAPNESPPIGILRTVESILRATHERDGDLSMWDYLITGHKTQVNSETRIT